MATVSLTRSSSRDYLSRWPSKFTTSSAINEKIYKTQLKTLGSAEALVSIASGETSRRKQGKHVGKKKRQCPADSPDDIPDFNSTHFPTTPMANRSTTDSWAARYTLIDPSDRRMLNDVVPVDQLPDCRTFQRPQPPPSAPEEHAPAPNDDQVQLLLGEVRTLSEQQAQFQQHILDEQ
ncbi:hypothetical protein CUMW_281460 [Citrus unshiu]|uniref:Uncharacterized protein n=1 Tax=Citrus unshiu TaxID=55188 RepID=A0A2H5MZ77_CITUN|nr:hypothetical protein CUMW_281460 [Citrus unshiu]